jgi:DNA-directed RNA polymerase subunit RPC12/RpoP
MTYQKENQMEVLTCPRCGHDRLHHGQVTVYSRRENAERTSVTTVRSDLSATHLLPSDEVSNPGRQFGVAIVIFCEECECNIGELTIHQRAGYEILGWRALEGQTPISGQSGYVLVYKMPSP